MIPGKKSLAAWCLYDWSMAGFPTIVTTFIFATYFTRTMAEDSIVGTYQWANATAIASFIIAFLSPLFGAIADYSGRQKIWLGFFTFLCIVSTALLWFSYPSVNYIYYTLACVVVGTIGFELAHVFYNSFLPHIAPRAYLGRISGWAWGMGYMGGIIILSISLFVFDFIKSHPKWWLNPETAANVRICGPLVAIWFGVFCMPLFLFVKDIPSRGLSFLNAIKQGMSELVQTIKTLPQQKNLFLYLIAHLIYIDGLNTLFAFGGIYAAGTFNMELSQIILLGIMMNITAGVGAILLAFADDLLGSKPTILISLFFLIIVGMATLYVSDARHFWALALCLALFVGPVQAASRTLMARMTPENKSTEMFGLYAFSGRITAFLGPWLLGLATLYFKTQRAGMATIFLFFIAGGLLMLFVSEPKKNSQ